MTLKPGGPDIIPEQVVASGQAQFGIDWLPASWPPATRAPTSSTSPRCSRKSGMTQLTWKDSGITTSPG